MFKVLCRRLRHTYSVLSLVDGGIFKVKALLIYVILSSKRWMGLRPVFGGFVRLPILWNGHRFNYYLRRQLDFDVLKDTFAADIYHVDIGVEPTVIIDLGSNVGTTSIKYLLMYPRAHVYAFEPDPENIESLRINTKVFGDRITIDTRAVAGVSREQRVFYTGSVRHWSSSLVDRSATVTDGTILVPTVSLSDILKEYDLKQVDIIKCDIEGSEYEVFSAFTDFERVQCIIGEFHPALVKYSFEEFLKLFPSFYLTDNSTHKVFTLLKK